MVITTQALMIGSYSPYQMKLSDRVIILREIDAMSYKGISELLTFQGFKSPRGCDLDSKIVFSIYKKRKIRDARLNGEPRIELRDIEFINSDLL